MRYPDCESRSGLHEKGAIVTLSKDERAIVEGFLREVKSKILMNMVLATAELLAAKGYRPGTGSSGMQYHTFEALKDLARVHNI